LLSTIAIVSAPLHFIWNKKPMQLIKSAFTVLIGRKSWVGFPLHFGNQEPKNKLPKIKEGIFNPGHQFPEMDLGEKTLLRLSIIYAKEYSIYKDVEIIWKGISSKK